MKKTIRIYIGIALVALITVLGGIVHFLMWPLPATDEEKNHQVLIFYMRYKKEFPDVQDVGPQEAMELVNTGKVVFIDARKPDEQSVSRLPGAITVDDFFENLEKYNDFIKIGYSTIGYRSGILARGLYQNQIPIYNLRGGLLAWVHAGGKVYNGSAESHRIHVYSREWDLGPDGYEAVR